MKLSAGFNFEKAVMKATFHKQVTREHFVLLLLKLNYIISGIVKMNNINISLSFFIKCHIKSKVKNRNITWVCEVQ